MTGLEEWAFPSQRVLVCLMKFINEKLGLKKELCKKYQSTKKINVIFKGFWKAQNGIYDDWLKHVQKQQNYFSKLDTSLYVSFINKYII